MRRVNQPPRVVFFVRSDLHRAPGGDTVQIDTTAAALRARGVEVLLTSDERIDLIGVDLAHLWHLERLHESYPFLCAAREAGLPVALSTIYYPASGEPRPQSQRRGKEDVKNLVRFCLSRSQGDRARLAAVLRRGWARCRGEMLTAVDLLIPNSQAEAKIVQAEAAQPPRIAVVPNVLMSDVFEQPEREPARRSGIYSVCHFDPRKNQLLLIEALRGTSHEVEFIGAGRPWHRRYYRRCVQRSAAAHRFLGPLPRPELLSHLAQAKLHVCPSRLETPGLANLEAAALGCQLVLPRCAPVQEYFGEWGFYFDPHDAASLREAVVTACRVKPNPELRRFVRSRFTAEALAATTLEAYATLCPAFAPLATARSLAAA